MMELTKKLRELTPDVLLFEVVKNKEVQDKIIDLNQRQLLRGVNSKNITLASINAYSESYAEFKNSNVVDLFYSGDFYKTFFVENRLGGFEIKANTTLYGYDFKDVYGEDILGLTDESKRELEEFLKPYILDYVHGYLQLNR